MVVYCYSSNIIRPILLSAYDEHTMWNLLRNGIMWSGGQFKQENLANAKVSAQQKTDFGMK